jgi:DNA-binding XRE family transcriptional regulator
MAARETTDTFKQNWFYLVQDISCRRVQLFTQGEIALYLNESRKTIIEFEKGNIFDARLLNNYAGILGYDLKIEKI